MANAKGKQKIDTDGLVTVTHTDTAGNNTKAISVPHNFFPGLVHSLHLKLKAMFDIFWQIISAKF